jgi:hypothetical protein
MWSSRLHLRACLLVVALVAGTGAGAGCSSGTGAHMDDASVGSGGAVGSGGVTGSGGDASGGAAAGGGASTGGINGSGGDGSGGAPGSGGAGSGGRGGAGSGGVAGSGGRGGGSGGGAGSGGRGGAGSGGVVASGGRGGAGGGSGGAPGSGGRGGAGSGGAATGGAPGSGGAASGGRGGGAGGAGGAGGGASDGAPVFDGRTGFVEIPDADQLSETATGAFTVEAWIRPDSTSMPRQESSGYVHWMGKGVTGQHEWVARMYQDGNADDRANRISFYSYNLTGGLGAGSYFQDSVTAGAWIHYAGEFDDVNTYIFKNGVLRDQDPLSGYDITPGNGTAPVRIGTRDMNSFFQGSIARVAIYSTRLPAQTLAAHAAATDARAYDAMVLAEPSLVAYWRLDEQSGTVAADALGRHNGTYRGTVTLRGATWRR